MSAASKQTFDAVRRGIAERKRQDRSLSRMAHLAKFGGRHYDRPPRLTGDEVAVYVILDDDGQPTYVGQTRHPIQRRSAHRASGLAQTDSIIHWLVLPSRLEAQRVETLTIACFDPPNNTVGRQFAWARRRVLVQPSFAVGPDGFIAVRTVVGAA